jgi:hypothetical protein
VPVLYPTSDSSCDVRLFFRIYISRNFFTILKSIVVNYYVTTLSSDVSSLQPALYSIHDFHRYTVPPHMKAGSRLKVHDHAKLNSIFHHTDSTREFHKLLSRPSHSRTFEQNFRPTLVALAPQPSRKKDGGGFIFREATHKSPRPLYHKAVQYRVRSYCLRGCNVVYIC